MNRPTFPQNPYKREKGHRHTHTHKTNFPFPAGRYYNFQRLSQWDELFSYLLAFVSFLSVLKMVHLLRFNRRISMLGCTLKRATADLTSFLFVFFIVFVAFFISGYILFGTQLPQYSKMVTSVETLLSVCLGEYAYTA